MATRGGFGQYRDFDGSSSGYFHGYGDRDGRRGSPRGRGYRPRGRGGPGFGFKKSFSDEVRDQVDELFSKKFIFQDEYQEWCLPDPSSMFKEEIMGVSKLLDLKEQLNATKSKLDTKEIISWHKHTNFTNRAGGIIPMLRKEFGPEMCTQAWAKFHEIIWAFNIVPQTASKCNSVHLCEAPGAFIASLNHYLKTHRVDCNWNWKAMTLNPYYEGNDLIAMIDQDKFMSETLDRWYLGVDNSGDVMLWENVAGLREMVKKEMEEVHLVTADGSINCVDNPGEQEAAVAQLLFCEVVTGLQLLKTGGALLLKMFTMLEHPTICLMYLLSCCFTELHIYKPATSKAGNSEQYVIGMGYKGRSTLTPTHFDKLRQAFGPNPPRRAMFPMATIPNSFLTQLTNCALKFAKYQMDAIEDNVKLYDCMRHSEKQFIQDMKELTCEKYKGRFKVKPLPREKAVVQHIHLNGTELCLLQPVQGDSNRRSTESFLARMEQRKRPWSARSETEEMATKQPRIVHSEASTHTVQHLLTILGFETSSIGSGSRSKDRTGDQGPITLDVEPEDVQWLKGPHNKPISLQDLKSLVGYRIMKVATSRFCRPEILRKLTEALDNAQVMQSSRADEHANITSQVTPGHALSGGHLPFYFNKDAVNFAALDYLINFTGKDGDGPILKFVDLAGAPSGFSHYICWKRQSTAKGWGMVRVESPKLGPGRIIDQLAPWENFQVLGPHSGVDICENNSIKSLCAGVENYSAGEVQLVIGDVPDIPFGAHSPGFAECHVKQYFLSQCICACKILRQGGTFICRVYEVLTRFSASLVYLMYRLFKEVSIVKPMTSSLTSPERFLICRGYHGCKPILTEMLLAVNSHISDLSRSDGGKQDVLEILPVQMLFDEQFYRYLTLSNERVSKQVTRMITIVERYFLDSQLLPDSDSQDLLRKGTLEILQLPEKPSLPHT